MEVGLEAANAGWQKRARPADDCLHRDRDRNFNRNRSTVRRVYDAITAHAEDPRVVAGRRGRTQVTGGASADGRGARAGGG